MTAKMSLKSATVRQGLPTAARCTLVAMVVLLHGVLSAVAAARLGDDLPPGTVSKYASLSKLKDHYVGPVDTLEDMTRMLERCSYMDEIILISTNDKFVDAAAQTLWMLRRFGIDHVLVLTTSQEQGEAVAAILPQTCVAWIDIWMGLPPMPESKVAHEAFANHRHLLVLRWMVAARMLRHGKNVMFLDTDIIIFEEPYQILKSRPFSDMNLVVSGHPLDVNVGIMYAQNAAPDGPVTWMFAEVADRIFRWAEQPAFLMEHVDPILRNFQHLVWEQAVFIDTLGSAEVGRPIFRAGWIWQGERAEFNSTWDAYHQKWIEPFTQEQSMALESEMARKIARPSGELIKYTNVFRVLNGERGWPPELGGPAFAPERGDYSRAFQQSLRDIPAPMWPETDTPRCRHVADLTAEDAPLVGKSSGGRPVLAPARGPDGGEADEETCARAPGPSGHPEKVSFSPGWLISYYTWKPPEQDWSSLLDPPEQLFGHNLFLPLDKGTYKTLIKMFTGWYSWKVANTTRVPGVYFASTRDHPVPKVLAASDLLLDQFHHLSLPQLLVAFRSLFAAAAAAGRAFAFPALPCDYLDRVRRTLQLYPNLTMAQRPFGGYDISVMPWPHHHKPNHCVWTAYFGRKTLDGDACLGNGRGVLPPEVHYMRSQLPPGTSEPGHHNTLILAHRSDGEPVLSATHSGETVEVGRRALRPLEQASGRADPAREGASGGGSTAGGRGVESEDPGAGSARGARSSSAAWWATIYESELEYVEQLPYLQRYRAAQERGRAEPKEALLREASAAGRRRRASESPLGHAEQPEALYSRELSVAEYVEKAKLYEDKQILYVERIPKLTEGLEELHQKLAAPFTLDWGSGCVALSLWHKFEQR